MLHKCTIHCVAWPSEFWDPLCLSSYIAKAPQGTDPRSFMWWCNEYQNGCKQFEWQFDHLTAEHIIQMQVLCYTRSYQIQQKMNFGRLCPSIWPHLTKIDFMTVKKEERGSQSPFWNASDSLAANLLDKFVGHISSYIGALTQHTMGLALSLGCTWQTSLLVGFGETLLLGHYCWHYCGFGDIIGPVWQWGGHPVGPPNAQVRPPEISVSIASFPAYLAFSANLSSLHYKGILYEFSLISLLHTGSVTLEKRLGEGLLLKIAEMQKAADISCICAIFPRQC